MRLVRADIYGLRESQLESARGATALQDLGRLLVLCISDPGHVSSHRAVTRSTGLLTIDAEVGVVGQKVKPVAESLNDCAGEISIAGFATSSVRSQFRGKRKLLIADHHEHGRDFALHSHSMVPGGFDVMS